MLIVALVLAVIGLAALVTAVVTSNELIAWVCIGASVIGVLLLIVDALRERSRGAEVAEVAEDGEASEDAAAGGDEGAAHVPDGDTAVVPTVAEPEAAEDYPEEPAETTAIEAEPSTVAAEATDDAGSESKAD